MHTQENTADVGLSVWEVYCMLSSLHCSLILFKFEECVHEPLRPDRGAIKPTQRYTQFVKKNHWTLPEMEILFTTVCAIVIKPMARGTYGIPSVIIGH